MRISRSFRMGVYEVTLGQFKQYIADAGRDDLLTDNFIKWNSGSDRTPVAYVSQRDAQGFIGWLNKKEGARIYRLPTEASGNTQRRAGTTTRYSWGNAIGRNRANCNGCGSQWDGKEPAPVGSFAANAFGLDDGLRRIACRITCRFARRLLGLYSAEVALCEAASGAGRRIATPIAAFGSSRI